MQEFFSEKSAVVYDWQGKEEDRPMAESFTLAVPESAFILTSKVIPFENYLGQDDTLDLGDITAQRVSEVTAEFMVERNIHKMNFEDAVEALRSQFNQSAKNESPDPDIDNPENVEIILSLYDIRILNEEENENIAPVIEQDLP